MLHEKSIMNPATHLTRPPRALLFFLIVLATILLPFSALAIPGSGDFVAVDSVSGRQITHLYNIIAKICWVVMVLVEGLLIIAILRFRRRHEDEQPPQLHGNMRLELAWTGAAILVQIYLGFITANVMFDIETLPETSMTVEAIARQWDWEFRYPDHGGIVHDDLVVPANTKVTLQITSQDVIHAIFIPEFGLKMDAVPGRINYFWFNADGPVNALSTGEQNRQQPATEPYVTTRARESSFLFDTLLSPDESSFYETVPGSPLERRVKYLAAGRDASTSPYLNYNAKEYRGMCAEMCGKDHWNMYFRVVAMTPSSFDQWLADKKSGANKGEANGQQLYAQSCATCHGQNGEGIPGTYPPLANGGFPTDPDRKAEHVEIVLKGLGQPVTVSGVTYDKNQMAIQNFGARMDDEEIAAVVNFERTSWGNDGGTVDAEFVANIRAQAGLAPFPAGGAEPVSDQDLMDVGKRVYESCVACHGQDGRGMASAPSFIGNVAVLSNIEASVKALDQGQDTPTWSGVQPPMGLGMTDRQVAGVLTYIRKSFGNDASAVQPAEVTRIRKELSK